MDMTEDIIFQKCITRWIYVIRIIDDPFVTVVGWYNGYLELSSKSLHDKSGSDLFRFTTTHADLLM